MPDVQHFETMRHEDGGRILLATCPPGTEDIHLHVILEHGHGYTAVRGDGTTVPVEPGVLPPPAYTFHWRVWHQLADMILGASPAARLVSETTQDAVTDARAVRDRLLTLVERLT